MSSKEELDSTYMGTAILHSKLSKALRAKVGAVLVTKQGVCLTGFNGTAIGRDNACEYREVEVCAHSYSTFFLKTKPETIHAELNCILKAAREGVSCLGATIYTTLSPCVPCSAMLVNAGVAEVVYEDKYADSRGLDLLQDCGIITRQVNIKE